MTEHERQLMQALNHLNEMEDGTIKRAYLRLREEANQRKMREFSSMSDGEREISLEKAEGDLLSRRRKCERLLGLSEDPVQNYDEGDHVLYGSLTVRVGSDHWVVEDVDGRSSGIINENELTGDPREDIEYLQEKLDRIHIETLAQL